MLSCVTSLKGLFLLKPVTREMLLSMSGTGNLVRERMWLREVEFHYLRQLETHE
jgi:hypothetical protein